MPPHALNQINSKGIGMAKNTAEVATSGDDEKLVRLIKDYALFLYKRSDNITLPISADWTNPDNLAPVGYNSEDGIVLHPEPGDTTDIKAHNGKIVRSITEPGYWTLQFAGIECRKSVAEAYFGVTADEHGAIHVKDATTPTEYSVIVAGIDIDGNPIVITAGKATVSDRDDVTLKNGETITFNLTLKLLNATDGDQYAVYGLLTNGTTPAPSAPGAQSDDEPSPDKASKLSIPSSNTYQSDPDSTNQPTD